MSDPASENKVLRFWVLEGDRANLYLTAGQQEWLGSGDAPWPPRQYAANLATLTGRVVYIAGMRDGSPWAEANPSVRRPARSVRVEVDWRGLRARLGR